MDQVLPVYRWKQEPGSQELAAVPCFGVVWAGKLPLSIRVKDNVGEQVGGGGVGEGWSIVTEGN